MSNQTRIRSKVNEEDHFYLNQMQAVLYENVKTTVTTIVTNNNDSNDDLIFYLVVILLMCDIETRGCDHMLALLINPVRSLFSS